MGICKCGIEINSIRDIYPNFTPEQQAEAERCLHKFIDVIGRIYRRNHSLLPLPKDQE